MERIVDDEEIDRILQTTDLDEFELVDSPTMQLEEPQENVGVEPAPTIDTQSTSGLAPRNGSSEELRPGVDPAQGSSPPYSPSEFYGIALPLLQLPWYDYSSYSTRSTVTCKQLIEIRARQTLPYYVIISKSNIEYYEY